MGTPPGKGVGRPTAVLIILATITAVAAILVLVTLFAAPDDDGDEQARDGVPSESVAPPECPPAPAEGESDPIDEIDPEAPDAVPGGATSVRLCQGPGTELTDAGTLLTDDVDDVVAVINGLETTGEPELCTADIGPGFRMVFGYPDGTTFIVSGKTYGCHELVVGSSYRVPATEPLELFRQLAAR